MSGQDDEVDRFWGAYQDVLTTHQTLLIRAIVLKEAKLLSEIESLVMTNDELRFMVYSGSVHVVPE